MMRCWAAVAALVSTVAFAAPSVAEPNGADAANDGVVSSKSEKLKVTARAAVMIRSYQADNTLTLRRNTGIESARRFGVGVYCLKPISGIKAKEAVASVSVNWISSYGNNLLATLAQPSYQCEPNEFEVRTYKFAPGGDAAESDQVSFTLVVP